MITYFWVFMIYVAVILTLMAISISIDHCWKYLKKASVIQLVGIAIVGAGFLTFINWMTQMF